MVERLGAETIVGCRLIAGSGAGTSRLLEHDLVLATIPGSPKIDIDDRCSLDYRAADVVWFDEFDRGAHPDPLTRLPPAWSRGRRESAPRAATA